MQTVHIQLYNSLSSQHLGRQDRDIPKRIAQQRAAGRVRRQLPDPERPCLCDSLTRNTELPLPGGREHRGI